MIASGNNELFRYFLLAGRIPLLLLFGWALLVSKPVKTKAAEATEQALKIRMC